METFFNLSDYDFKSDYKCRDCVNTYCIEYDSGKRFYYCSFIKDNRTYNGLKKIRLKDMACKNIKLRIVSKVVRNKELIYD